MNRNYRLRVVLDTEEDVIRDIVISADEKLSRLHESVVTAFNLYPGEMASFYRSNGDWEQGAEISLENFGYASEVELMVDKKIGDMLGAKGDRLIYVYDLLNLWTFFLEVVATEETTDASEPLIYKIKGERPEKAPAIMMESINLSDEVDLPEDDFEQEEYLYED